MKCKDQETCWHDPICTSFEKSTVINKTEREKLVDKLYDAYGHYVCRKQIIDIAIVCESHFRREHREIVTKAIEKTRSYDKNWDAAERSKAIDNALKAINKALSDDK